MFKALALGGGGIRGFLIFGALKALQKQRGNLTFPDGVYGCSVGAVIATAIAFGLTSEQIEEIGYKFVNTSAFLPSYRHATILAFTQKKGLFTMDLMEELFLRVFDSVGIDLRGKMISDAPQKLYMVASNITTQKMTLLTGNIPLLAAMKASCCLPFIYHPQVIHNQLYLDGGVYAENMTLAVPKGTLVFDIAHIRQPVFTSTLESMSIFDMVRTLWAGLRSIRATTDSLNLHIDGIYLLDELKDEDKTRMIEAGYAQALRFFAKRLPKEVEDVVSGHLAIEVNESA
jgi:predicted acylesterase/phospholipase RssA